MATAMNDQLLAQLISARAAADPRLRQLLPLFGIDVGHAVPPMSVPPAPLPSDGPVQPIPTPEPEPEPTPNSARPSDLLADRGAAYRGLRGVEAELRRCHGLLRQAAGALGACSACLGTETECRYCAGAGVSGAFEVDQLAFQRLVRPLLIQDTMGESTGGPRVRSDL